MPLDPRDQYKTIRVPLVENPAPRDYTASQDARLINCYVEDGGNENTLPFISRRQGISLVNTIGATTNCHGIYFWQATGFTYVNYDGTLYNALTGASIGITSFFNTNAHASYAESDVVGSNRLIITTDTFGYTLTGGGVLANIADVNFPGNVATLVPGIVNMDGFTFIGVADGRIFNSNLSAPTVWNSLGFVSASAYPDPLVAISRHLNYIVALGETSTQFFYNAGNPAPASPLSPVPNTQFEIGCAASGSIVQTENSLIWMSQTSTRGFSVLQLNGFKPNPISTPYIDRMLTISMTTSNTRQITAYSVKQRGHTFYVLNVPAIDKTFIYDLSTQRWDEWRIIQSLGTNLACTIAINATSGAVVVTTGGAHGLTTGLLVTLSGFLPNVYNDTFPCYVIDATHFSVPTTQYNNPVTTSAGLYAVGLDNLFLGRYATSTRGNTALTYFASKLGGQIYQQDYITQSDIDPVFPVNMSIITPNVDTGDLSNKNIYSLEMLHDKPASVTGSIIPVYVSWSDDDYVTWAPFRIVPQNRIRSIIRRLGSGRRRAFWIQYFGSREYRIQTMELKIEHGDS